MFILDDLLIGLPAKGIIGIFKKVIEMAEAEYLNEDTIREELQNVQSAYEIGQMSEEEYQAQEDVLLQRLNLAMEEKNEAKEPVLTLLR